MECTYRFLVHTVPWLPWFPTHFMRGIYSLLGERGVNITGASNAMRCGIPARILLTEGDGLMNRVKGHPTTKLAISLGTDVPKKGKPAGISGPSKWVPLLQLPCEHLMQGRRNGRTPRIPSSTVSFKGSLGSFPKPGRSFPMEHQQVKDALGMSLPKTAYVVLEVWF